MLPFHWLVPGFKAGWHSPTVMEDRWEAMADRDALSLVLGSEPSVLVFFSEPIFSILLDDL